MKDLAVTKPLGNVFARIVGYKSEAVTYKVKTDVSMLAHSTAIKLKQITCRKS